MDDPSFYDVGPDYPMYYVSWDEAQKFIQKVNAMDQGSCRLPSEAEWEYACRAGTQSRYYFGDNEAELGEYAWYAANSGNMTHPVGRKRPNVWGLFDMHGNVNEWCQDWLHENYNGAPADGSARETPAGQHRVLRGGAWINPPVNCRAAYRNSVTPDNRSYGNYGIRLARTQF
jgi:formylglycine-generating enzyme required for sulfatase activity